MKTKDYIFCALDFSELEESISFTKKIKNQIGGVKLGLEFSLKMEQKVLKNLKN